MDTRASPAPGDASAPSPTTGDAGGRDGGDSALLVARERRHLEELIAQVPGVVWEAFPRAGDGALVAHLVSRQAESLLGYPLARWRDTPEFWLDITHGDDREAVRMAVRDVMAGDGIGTLGFRWQHRDGRVLWMEAHLAVLVDGTGAPAGVRAVTVDVSRWRHDDEVARREREQIARAARVTTINDLAASLAHELNQPLNAILNNAEAARLKLERRRPPLAEIAEILDDIVADDQRAGDIIRCVRDQVGFAARESLALDVNPLLDDVAHLLHGEALLRGVTLEFVPAPVPLAICGDRVQLQQVVLNLVANAFAAVGANPRARRHVVVRALHSGTRFAVVAVEDSGPGIDPAAPQPDDRLFDSEGRARTGLGLGLAIVRGIVDAHGGRLWTANHRAGGALFVVGLPLADPGSPRGG